MDNRTPTPKVHRLVRWCKAVVVAVATIGWMWLGSVPGGHKWW